MTRYDFPERRYTSEFEQWLNLIQPDLIAHFVKSSCELRPIMTIYNDFPEARRVNLSNFWTYSNFT